MSTFDYQRDELDDAIRFIRLNYQDELAELIEKYPKDSKTLFVEYGDLAKQRWSNKATPGTFADHLQKAPDEFLDLMDDALEKVDHAGGVTLDDASVTVRNIPDFETYEVGEYRAEQRGEFVSINGQVSKTTPVKPKIEEAAFTCTRCGTVTRITQVGTDFHEPHECKGCERNGPFNINFDESEFKDHQLARVTLPPEKASGQGASIDVHLEGDIVDTIQPGDRADVNGVLKFEQEGSQQQKKPTFDFYLEGKSADPDETAFEDIDVDEHLEDIKEIASGERGDPYELLRESLAPKIHGYKDIKEAIVLQLFGGVQVKYPDGSVDRGDPHILLLGDPGTAKSSLLRSVEELAPRATYASGKGASAAGMTAAVVADDFGENKFSLEAGALVLAHKGIACVDEIDKIDEQARSSLHDALESQRVNVNKAGINATLPAETAMLAAGNPKHGRFDTREPIADQFNLGPTLMSRFDLKFAVKDDPDEETDRELVQHMTESRALGSKYTHANHEIEDGELDKIDPDIDRDLYRAYIAYAKQNVKPRIKEQGVHEMIWDGYISLRSDGYDEDSPIPITARNAEAVQRLAEASARIELREEVLPKDVERARQLVFSSLQDVGIDPETGEFDADIVETGTSKVDRDNIKLVIEMIQEAPVEDDEDFPRIDTVLDMAEDSKVGRNTAKYIINKKLKKKGDAYEPRDGYIELI